MERAPKRGLKPIEVAVLAVLVLVLGFFLLQLPRIPELVLQYRASGCLSHLRQLAAATQLYLADNDDMFPYAGRDAPYANNLDVWVGLSPYVAGNEVFLCPQDKLPALNQRWVSKFGKRMKPSEITIPSSYGYTMPFYHPFDCSKGRNDARPPRSMPLSAVLEPSRKALFICYGAEFARGPSPKHHPAGWALTFVDGSARLAPFKKLNRAVEGKGNDQQYNFDWTLCGLAGRDLR